MWEKRYATFDWFTSVCDENLLRAFSVCKSLWVLAIMPKIPEISVGIQMERSVSVSSDLNTRDHLRGDSGGGPLISVGIFQSKFAVPFLANRFFALIREFRNDKNWQELYLLVGAV